MDVADAWKGAAGRNRLEAALCEAEIYPKTLTARRVQRPS